MNKGLIQITNTTCIISGQANKLKGDVMSGLKNSSEWQREIGTVFVDHDGWDRANFAFSFNEQLISRAEYERRVSQSTIAI